MQDIGHPEHWAQFGLAGLVIFALFLALLFVFRTHHDERREWRNEMRVIHDQSNSAIDGLKHVNQELIMAIKELSWKTKTRTKGDSNES